MIQSVLDSGYVGFVSLGNCITGFLESWIAFVLLVLQDFSKVIVLTPYMNWSGNANAKFYL